MIKEVGSPGGSKVKVEIPRGNKIVADKVYVNVLIKIGDQTYKFDRTKENIKAHLDQNGKIRIF